MWRYTNIIDCWWGKRNSWSSFKVDHRWFEMVAFPSTERFSKIIPAYKSDERTIIENYRPISVVSIISKIFGRIVDNQLYDYLEANNMLSESKFDFQEDHPHNLQLPFSHISSKPIWPMALFTDLRKVFDAVDHARLLSKLPLYGIKSKKLCWFKSYLIDRKQIEWWDFVRNPNYFLSTTRVHIGSIGV